MLSLHDYDVFSSLFRQFLITSNLEQIVLKFKNLPAKKLKVLMALFFGAGILGILHGIISPNLLFTIMGVTNLMLGALVGWIFLTREPRDSRKKRKK